MPSYKFLYFSNARPGRDDEFNTWYDEVHLGDLLAIPGFVGASRYVLKSPDGSTPKHKYLAIYDIEGDTDAIFAEVKQRSPGMVMSDAMDRENTERFLFECITPLRKA